MSSENERSQALLVTRNERNQFHKKNPPWTPCNGFINQRQACGFL